MSFAKTPQEPESHPCNMLRSPLYAAHFKCVLNFGEGHLVRQRAQLIMQVQNGLLSAQEAARQLRISRKTYYKWERRAEFLQKQGERLRVIFRDGRLVPFQVWSREHFGVAASIMRDARIEGHVFLKNARDNIPDVGYLVMDPGDALEERLQLLPHGFAASVPG